MGRGDVKGNDIDEPMTLNQVVTRLTLRDMLERGEEDDESDHAINDATCFQRLRISACFNWDGRRILPHQTSIDEDNVEEERRLAYVGITRAQQTLTFSLCKERRQFGELLKPEPSRFWLNCPLMMCSGSAINHL